MSDERATVTNERGYKLALAFLDADDEEYPAEEYLLKENEQHYGQDLWGKAPIETIYDDPVLITHYRVFIDGTQFDQPLPYRGGELFQMNGSIELTVLGPLIEGLISVIEQVANS